MTTLNIHPHKLDLYGTAETLEDLGELLCGDDEAGGCVLDDEHDALTLELGDYLDEVLVDPTEDEKARVIRGYRWTRDHTPTDERLRDVHENLMAKRQGDGSILMRCPNPDHPDQHPSFLIQGCAGKCLSCGYETTVDALLKGN